jgi:predicted ATP-grasp superfamily ATP-dependent carboligase
MRDVGTASPTAETGVPAIGLGGTITGLAVLRALGRRGVPTWSVRRDTTLAARSRWCRRLPGSDVEETEDGERLARHLRSLPFPRTVLFPCSDRWALAVATLPVEDAAAHATTVARADVLRVLVDKQRFADAAEGNGVPAPRVLPASRLDELDEAELPSFFLKPCESQPFSERYGVKAFRAATRREAAALIERATADGHELVLQELIPGPATAHVFLDGYVDRAGAVRACLARRRLRMHPPQFGNSTLTATIPRDELAQASESLFRLFRGLGFTGMFDAEFKLDPRDGRFKILEVNARPWWQLALSTASGLDVCALAYDDALGREPPETTGYRVGSTWVHPAPDVRAWWAGAAARGRLRRSPAAPVVRRGQRGLRLGRPCPGARGARAVRAAPRPRSTSMVRGASAHG